MQYFGFDRTIGQGRVFSFDAGASEIIRPLLPDYLLGGNGKPAVDYAMSQLAGTGIAYVLEPASSRAKYTAPAKPSANKYEATDGANGIFFGPTKAAACAGYFVVMTESLGARSQKVVGGSCMFGEYHSAAVNINGAAAPDVPAKVTYIPIATIADKIRANAVAGHAPSQTVVDATI